MEGFGQCATSHSRLAKQTWAVFHGRVGRDGNRAPFWAQAGVVLLFSAPVLAGREGFGARNEGKGPVPLWSNFQCAWKCKDLTAALRLSLLLCTSPGSAPFSCPFIHSSLSCPPTCVLTLEGMQLSHSVTPHASLPPADKEAAAGRDGELLWERPWCGRIRIHSCPCLAETGSKGKVIC